MATQIDVEKIISNNPNVDPDQFRRGEEALKELQRTGAVRRSSYGLDTPESKRGIHPAGEQDTPECLPAFRRLR